MGRPPVASSSSALVAAVTLALVVLGCESGRGTRVTCTCRFLTDHDDLSSQRVDLCVSSSEKAAEEARGCAQSASPGPVQSCECLPAASGEPCSLGDCRAHEQ